MLILDNANSEYKGIYKGTRPFGKCWSTLGVHHGKGPMLEWVLRTTCTNYKGLYQTSSRKSSFDV